MRREIKISLVIAVILIAGGFWLATRHTQKPDATTVASNTENEPQQEESAPIVSPALAPSTPITRTEPPAPPAAPVITVASPASQPAETDMVSSPAPSSLVGTESPSDRPEELADSTDPTAPVGITPPPTPTAAVHDDDMPAPSSLLSEPPGALTEASSTPMHSTSRGIPTAVQPPSTSSNNTHTNPPKTDDSTIHVVKSGENFTTIAQQYYKNGKYATRIAQANPRIDPRRLQIGAKIKIPAIAEATDTDNPNEDRKEDKPAGVTSAAPIISMSAIPEGRSYTVKAGEGWRQLARRFLGHENKWPVLYELNKGRIPVNPEGLRAGMAIELPEGVSADTTATKGKDAKSK